MSAVRDRPERGRYELEVEGGTAFAAYEREGNAIVFTHTVVPEAARGGGDGTRLIEGALADARAKRLDIVAQCPFVAAYLQRHPEAAGQERG